MGRLTAPSAAVDARVAAPILENLRYVLTAGLVLPRLRRRGLHIGKCVVERHR